MFVIWCRQQLARLGKKCINAFQNVMLKISSTCNNSIREVRSQVPGTLTPIWMSNQDHRRICRDEPRIRELPGISMEDWNQSFLSRPYIFSTGSMPVKSLFPKSACCYNCVERKCLYPRCSTGRYNYPTKLGLWKRFHPKFLSKNVNTCTICDETTRNQDIDIFGWNIKTNVELELAVVVVEVPTLEEQRWTRWDLT
jgi:hypothetical protein